MEQYLPRVSDKILNKHLASKGAVLIEGPKWCGKTTTAMRIAKSTLFMNRPGFMNQYRELAAIDPSALLDGDVPRLIDEWQLAPTLWDAVRYEVDQRKDFGQFILTGSAVPTSLDSGSHTGTGRIVRMMMRPMSLFESQDSDGQVSLNHLFQAGKISAQNHHSLSDIAYFVCRGGWPKAIGYPEAIALQQAYDYFDAIINDDISRVDEVQRDKEYAKRLLRSYAGNIGTQASLELIRLDAIGGQIDTFSQNTLYSYLSALRKIFVLEDAPAWNPNLRSKTAIRTSDTHYFIDSSIAVAALGVGPEDLIQDLKTFGFLFENLCVRDLRIYSEVLGGNVYHFRDKSGLECDAVVHLRNGEYGLIEIKFGGDKLIDEGAKTLKKLAQGIDSDRMKRPAFLLVLTGVAPFAYQRGDGVYVVPIGSLAP